MKGITKGVLKGLLVISVNIVFWGGLFASTYYFSHPEGQIYDMRYNQTPHRSVTKRNFNVGYKTFRITTTTDTVYMPVDSANYEPPDRL